MKKMYRFTPGIFIFIGILVSGSAIGKPNFISGYIVQLNGDTVRGWIDYGNWGKNPVEIFFRHRPEEMVSIFKPLSIRSFGVQNEIYLGAVVKAETSTDQVSELNFDRAFHFRSDTVFLMALVQGPKSLYYYRDPLRKEQFYIPQDSGMELLLYKRYLQSANSQDRIWTDNSFISQLSSYLKDCPSLYSELANAKYNSKSLQNIFNSYYKCTNRNIPYSKKSEGLKTEWGLESGISITSLHFKSEPFYFNYLVHADFKPSVNYTGGVFLNVVFPRNFGKWSLFNDLTYTDYSISGNYEFYTSASQYTKTRSELGFSYLQWNSQVRCKFPAGKIFLFANLGASYGYFIRETNKVHIESVFFSTTNLSETEAIAGPRRYELSLLLGTGAYYKNLSAEIRLQKGNGMSDNIYLGVATTRYLFMLGYRF